MREAVTRFSNASLQIAVDTYGSSMKAAVILLTQWEASIDPDTYYTGANSGAENITWPTLAERSAWFKERRAALKVIGNMAKGRAGSGGYASFRDVPIGEL
jgi:hypothetical protein